MSKTPPISELSGDLPTQPAATTSKVKPPAGLELFEPIIDLDAFEPKPKSKHTSRHHAPAAHAGLAAHISPEPPKLTARQPRETEAGHENIVAAAFRSIAKVFGTSFKHTEPGTHAKADSGNYSGFENKAPAINAAELASARATLTQLYATNLDTTKRRDVKVVAQLWHKAEDAIGKAGIQVDGTDTKNHSPFNHKQLASNAIDKIDELSKALKKNKVHKIETCKWDVTNAMLDGFRHVVEKEPAKTAQVKQGEFFKR